MIIDKVKQAKKWKKVFAVGTTTLRAIEMHSLMEKHIKALRIYLYIQVLNLKQLIC